MSVPAMFRPPVTSPKKGRGVLYMMTGDKHCVHLVVSVYALRTFYGGPICIAAGDDKGEELAQMMAKDWRLRPIRVIRWNAPTRRTAGKGSGVQYMNKCAMLNLTPFEQTVFIDADTLPVAAFPELWPEGNEVRLTQFAQWTTETNKIRRRVNTDDWRQAAPELVDRQLAHAYPALNTGVIGFPDSAGPFFETWAELTAKNICFMCDELAAQLMFLDFPHLVLDDRWNCSPIYSWDEKPGADGQGTRRADARIYHGHGFKFTKSQWGRRLWFPWVRAALDFNIAGIAGWFPGADGKLQGYLRNPARYEGSEEERALLLGEEAA